MTPDGLQALAEIAGLATQWTDYRGARRDVEPEVLRAVLAAMAIPASTQSDVAESRRRLSDRDAVAPAPLVTAQSGGAVAVKAHSGKGRLILEDGRSQAVALTPDDLGIAHFAAPDIPGYHLLEFGQHRLTLAVAPKCGWTIAHGAPGRRLWGLAVQLYGLRGGHTAGFGDFAALATFVEGAARHGADAVSLSPTHALFTADPRCYAPYGPSTRLFLNPLYAGLGIAAMDRIAEDGNGLIDWPAASARKLADLHAAYRAFRDDPGALHADFTAFVAAGGEALLSHARFEALDSRFRPRGMRHWREWPEGFAESAGLTTRSLAADDPEVEIHLFLQFLAERSLSDAQRRARAAGMAIGLIADIAVGMDGAGSDAWSRPDEVLGGITIGAPPDLLGPHGQNWGLTTFSPLGLTASGYAGFIAMLRAAMRNAGGVRIDHAMGLQRLWVVPEGADAGQGTYLSYPLTDLLRLLALESFRHQAIVVGEDLGTVPPGFRERSAAAGMLGMRVLWFERTGAAFTRAHQWDADALALTTTHDLPTVSGWWRGRDIDWREKTGGDTPRANIERAERAADRPLLWRALTESGAATGDPPPDDQPERVIDGALSFIAATPSALAIAPVEDLLGLSEQPNLPGTIDQHPNWRRRLPPGDPLGRPDAVRRMAILNAGRRT